MENEIMEKKDVVDEEKNQYLRVDSNHDVITYQISPEALEAVCALGASVMGKVIDAKKETLIAAIDKEIELQISQMEKTVKGQSKALDTHESKQRELLSSYLKKQEIYAQNAKESTTLEEKTGWLNMLKETEEKLIIAYLNNNATLDSALEKTKHRAEGIFGRLISKFNR